jgi:DNA-directed RNA polymerase specialized sigma subunit
MPIKINMPGVPESSQEEVMKRRKARKSPPQVTLGGKVGEIVWRRYIAPLLRKDISTREIGEMLGVSHMTVARWRSAYL